VILALFLVLLVLFVALPVAGMALWALVSTVFVGLVIGALGRLIVPGRQRISLIATILAGVAGGIIGGFLGNRVFYVGWFATTLLEVAVAAGLVMLMTRPRGAHVSRLR
jgi:uncharacterized membrane protein YeaQ/YmgE (transglycosylase-associated protein family)